MRRDHHRPIRFRTSHAENLSDRPGLHAQDFRDSALGRANLLAIKRVQNRLAHVFASTIEAQRVLDAWRHAYNHVRPHSALQDRTPVEMGALWGDSREARESTAVRKDRID